MELANFLSADALRLERVLPAAPERVWAHLIDAKKRARWFCAGDDINEVGQAFELHFNHHRITDEPPPEKYKRFDGTQPDYVSRARVTAFEPNKLLRFDWQEESGGATDVKIELIPMAQGTRVVITHAKLPSRKELINVGGGWNAHLAVLEDELAARPHRGFWSNIARFEEELERAAPR